MDESPSGEANNKVDYKNRLNLLIGRRIQIASGSSQFDVFST